MLVGSGRGRGKEDKQAETLHEHQGEEGGRRNRQGHAGTSSQGGTRVVTFTVTVCVDCLIFKVTEPSPLQESFGEASACSTTFVERFFAAAVG
jgi:hypothetical protein